MARKRRPAAEFVADVTVADDGIRPVRRSKNLWSRDKLGILASYLRAFNSAARRVPAGRYFVDGMAGPGLYEFPDGTFVLGSTPIALWTSPGFTRCLAIEKSARHRHALDLRTRMYGDRAIIRQGDCNRDLLPLMEEFVPQGAATLVFLDPEGYALNFGTIAAVAGFRQPKKVEMLILIDTGSLPRTIAGRLHDEIEVTAGPWNFDWALPFDWRAMAQRYVEADLTADALREEAAERFCAALRTRLGYRHAFARRITRRDPDQAAIYHLAFASDDDIGAKIMSDVFASMWSNMPSANTRAALSDDAPLQSRLFKD